MRIPFLVCCTLFAAPAEAQVTEYVSLGLSGALANASSASVALSPDGRFVAFVSSASNLVAGDTNGKADVFLRDRYAGLTERVSLGAGAGQADLESGTPALTPDGRFVAFSSLATNLVAGDTNGDWDVFVRDRLLGTTERVSVSSAGAQGNWVSHKCSISADGRYVAFISYASNLVVGDTLGFPDAFLRDRATGTTERVNVTNTGAEANLGTVWAEISADGNCVVFWSGATNLVSGDTNGFEDVFVRELASGTTERVSVAGAGIETDGTNVGGFLSADGRFVAFTSWATNLASGDTNGTGDVYVRDRLALTTTRASLSSAGAQPDMDCNLSSIAADGRSVAFTTTSALLVAQDTNGLLDVFVRDLDLGLTERVSVAQDGSQGNGNSIAGDLSADGRFVPFLSAATNLVPGDTNGVADVFLRDRRASGATSLCDAGSGGVIGCPCANPPAGAGRGCDNSSTTGGALLAAAGIAYLAQDSLVFTTSGEKPTATSIVLQGNALAPAGIVFGQGVRCVAGVLKRLYVKSAQGGSITAPDLPGGDPSVSARSAQLGDVIPPGASRGYLVYYRDPTVLGGCSATSTFNATQSVRVDWQP